MTPASRSELAGELVEACRVSQRRFCRALGWPRTSVRYCRKRPGDAHYHEQVRRQAHARPRFGYRRIKVMLTRGGMRLSRARTLRIMKALSLTVVRRRKVRALPQPTPVPMPRADRPDVGWAIDFASEQLATGERIRVFSVVDECTRELLLSRVAVSFKATDVRAAMEELLVMRRSIPRWIRSDNGPEFIAEEARKLLARNGIDHALSRPGKPTDNARVESFHSRFRDELLDRVVFPTIQEAQRLIDDYREDYNRQRPHSALAYLTPHEYHQQLEASR